MLVLYIAIGAFIFGGGIVAVANLTAEKGNRGRF